MFKFIKQIFFSTLMYFGSLSSVKSLECISMKNQECKERPEIVNISRNFMTNNIMTNKCSGNCNGINDPYAKICMPDIVKYLNIKVFNLLSGSNETRHINGMKRVSMYAD